MRALAYHTTWGTYGTRLHGDPRKTVDREQNEFGTPVLGFDEHRWEACKERLKYTPIYLSRAHMLFIEACVPSLCERGHWRYHACAAGPDHVHVVLASAPNPETIRRLLKRWLGQELSSKWQLDGGEDRTWWAECGSIRWILDQQYFDRAVATFSGRGRRGRGGGRFCARSGRGRPGSLGGRCGDGRCAGVSG